MHEAGLGVPQSTKKALELFDLAAFAWTQQNDGQKLPRWFKVATLKNKKELQLVHLAPMALLFLEVLCALFSCHEKPSLLLTNAHICSRELSNVSLKF